ASIRRLSSAPIAETTAVSEADSGGYSRPTCSGSRKSVCHFDGSGTGTSGNVGVIGIKGHSVNAFHQRHLMRPRIGKISALPTVTNGTIGTPWRSANTTQSFLHDGPMRCARLYGVNAPRMPSG